MNRINRFIFSKWGDELFTIESSIGFGIIAYGLALIVNSGGINI